MQSELLRTAQKRLHALGVDLQLPPDVSTGDNLVVHSNVPNHAWLSIGLPSLQFAESGLQDLFWCPRGLPSGTSLFIASSRLGRELSRHSDWFDAFRTLTCRMATQKQFAVTAAKTTADRFVQRASQLFGFDILEFSEAPKKIDSHWLANAASSDDKHHYPCFRIPVQEQIEIDRDELLCRVAAEVRVLSIRKGGKTEQALLDRCQRLAISKLFLLRSTHSRSNIPSRLLQAGAHPWFLYSKEEVEQRNHQRSKDGLASTRFRVPVVNQLPPGEFLIHCTRPRVGPWPDQDEDQYLDDLIFQTHRQDHSAEATLTRILCTGRLCASNQLTRSQQKVVCFTAARIDDLPKLKKFQSHLSRWDFLPIGIAIQKSSLMKLGAQPVIYGDESTWSKLSEEEQPFFQIATTTTPSGKTIDWSNEREWRVVGDLDLNLLGEGEIFAFRTE